MKLVVAKKISEDNSDIVLLWNFGENFFACNNPTELTIENWSYSVGQDLWWGLQYVGGTCQANGITVTLRCVLDTNTGDIIPHWKAIALYNYKSEIEHGSWDIFWIWEWNIQWGSGTCTICWAFWVVAQGNLAIALSWVSQLNKDAD